MLSHAFTSKRSKASALKRGLLFFACAKKSNQKKAQPSRRARRCAPGSRDSRGFSKGHPCPFEKRTASCRAPYGPDPRIPPLRWASKIKSAEYQFVSLYSLMMSVSNSYCHKIERHRQGEAMPICKMCKQNKEKLIRCHIYPESMSKEISGDPHCLVSMSERGHNLVSGYAPGGIYDKDIVCLSCEAFFKEADDYAIDFRRKVLRLEMPVRLLLNSIKFPTFDASAEKLHKFAMQTWLRSHLSQRYENQQIENPETAELISEIILNRKETIDTGIEVSFLFFTSELAQVMMSPVHYQAPDFPVYSIWMPNMNILISASEKGLPPAFSVIRLQRHEPVTVLRSKKVFDSMFETISDGVLPHFERLEFLFDKNGKKK
jgi:hypothetical protein